MAACKETAPLLLCTALAPSVTRGNVSTLNYCTIAVPITAVCIREVHHSKLQYRQSERRLLYVLDDTIEKTVYVRNISETTGN